MEESENRLKIQQLIVLAALLVSLFGTLYILEMMNSNAMIVTATVAVEQETEVLHDSSLEIEKSEETTTTVRVTNETEG